MSHFVIEGGALVFPGDLVIGQVSGFEDLDSLDDIYKSNWLEYRYGNTNKCRGGYNVASDNVD